MVKKETIRMFRADLNLLRNLGRVKTSRCGTTSSNCLYTSYSHSQWTSRRSVSDSISGNDVDGNWEISESVSTADELRTMMGALS